MQNLDCFAQTLRGLAMTRLRLSSPQRRFIHNNKGSSMPSGLEVTDIYIFILAGFLGFQLIMRIPPLLHTPLMAATNAISGIALVGSIVVAGENYDMITNILAFIAVTCSTINVVGGFLITDRILKMFKKEKPVKPKSNPS